MKTKWGALMVDGSGKIGGHVAAKNRGGSYLRTKKTPLNPNTTAQANARSILSSLSSQWRELTDAQRQSFNDAVADFAKTDVFGDIRNPSGINLFVKLNANLSNAGLALVLTAPTKVEVPYSQIITIEMDRSSQTATITTAGAEIDTEIVKIQATPPQSAGVSFVKSQLRTISSDSNITNATAIYGDYVSKFGVPPIGGNIFFTVAVITATGQQGTAQKVKATVVA